MLSAEACAVSSSKTYLTPGDIASSRGRSPLRIWPWSFMARIAKTRDFGGQGPPPQVRALIFATNKNSPVDADVVSGDAQGWRAAASGSQTIRLVFDHPQRLRCISLVFKESETARTQEFVLRWSPDSGNSVKEIVRQQWNFSPPDSVREVEEYQVELSAVTVLELIINPNISSGGARASLKILHLA